MSRQTNRKINICVAFFFGVAALAITHLCYAQGIAEAVRNRDAAKVKKFLAQDCSLANSDCQAERIGSLLHYAAWFGDEKIAKMLLDCGAQMNARNLDHNTPLLYAATWGHTAIVKILLDRGAEVCPLDNYDATPLHAAAAGGFLEIIKLLLKHGANKYIRDQTGHSPEDFAKEGGFVDAARYIRTFVPMKSKREISDSLTSSGDMLLGLKNFHDAAQIYRDAIRVDTNAYRYYQLSLALEGEGKLDESIEACDKSASFYGEDLRINPYLRLGQLYFRSAAYDKAAAAFTSRDITGFIDLENWKGFAAFGELSAQQLSHAGPGAIRFAMYAPHVDIHTLDTLVKQGFDVNAADSDNNTALLAFALSHTQGGVELAKYLIEHGANPNAANKKGVTPQTVAFYHDGELYRFLKNLPIAPPADGRPPAHLRQISTTASAYAPKLGETFDIGNWRFCIDSALLTSKGVPDSTIITGHNSPYSSSTVSRLKFRMHLVFSNNYPEPRSFPWVGLRESLEGEDRPINYCDYRVGDPAEMDSVMFRVLRQNPFCTGRMWLETRPFIPSRVRGEVPALHFEGLPILVLLDNLGIK